MSRVALLDINVLIALFDPDHIHHEIAHDWFADQRADGWATCPLTENGFIRILTNPVYASPAQRPDEIIEHLRAFRASGQHHFWTDAVSLSDQRLFKPSFIRSHRHVTDIYLLGLAKHSGGSLATFDRTIPLGAVTGATRSTLLVIEGER